MIDYTPTLISAIKSATGLEVYYELIANSSYKKPCITYQIYDDYTTDIGDTQIYSTLRYMIKLWGTNVSVLTAKKALLDSKMIELGFERVSYNELTYDNQICMAIVYEAIAHEDITIGD